MPDRFTPSQAAAVRVVAELSLREFRQLMLEIDPDLRVSPSSIQRWELGLSVPRPRNRRAWHTAIDRLLADLEGAP